jgi:hypothetical protein
MDNLQDRSAVAFRIGEALRIWDQVTVDQVVHQVTINGVGDSWMLFLERDMADHKECLEHLYFGPEENTEKEING